MRLYTTKDKKQIITEEIEINICNDYKKLIIKKILRLKYNIGWRVLEKILSKYKIESNKPKAYLTGRKKKSMYDYWIIRYGKEEADSKMSEYGKKRSAIHSGRNNPMYGKPSPNGSGNGYKGHYKNHYFRSLRELSYIIYLDKNNIKWESAEQKKFNIKYNNYDGTDRTYRPDFFLVETNTLVEIKPIRLQNSPLILLKTKAATDFATKNNLTYKIMDFEINSDFIKTELDKGLVIFKRDYKERFLSSIQNS